MLRRERRHNNHKLQANTFICSLIKNNYWGKQQPLNIIIGCPLRNSFQSRQRRKILQSDHIISMVPRLSIEIDLDPKERENKHMSFII